VLPCYDEQEVLPLTHARFTAMGPHLAAMGLDYELVFINDGSRDRTPEILNELASRDRHVRVVHLARNFGHQAAVSAGLSVARGDCVAVMDCDLQDPPEVLPDFLAKWREGYQVIYAIRKKRKEWLGKRLAYWTFYRLLAAVSDLDIPLDSGDFCVMDRSAINLLNSLPERQRFIRGLRTWIGLRQTGIEYERPARAAGQPQYTFSKLVKLAMDGLVSFSSVPLKMVTRLGLLSLFSAFAIGLWVVGVTIYEWDKGIIGRTPRGWASLACIVLIMSAVQMISLGIIGEYLARIFLEVKGRPTFLIGSIVEGRDAPPAPEPKQSETTPKSEVVERPIVSKPLSAGAASVRETV
jgi:dolichol-phosphate mannosyltransferase